MLLRDRAVWALLPLGARELPGDGELARRRVHRFFRRRGAGRHRRRGHRRDGLGRARAAAPAPPQRALRYARARAAAEELSAMRGADGAQDEAGR